MKHHQQFNTYISRYLKSVNYFFYLIFQIHYEKIDWAIGGISATYERVHLVDFTAILKEEPYGIVFSVPNANTLRWDAVLLPFKKSVWACFISAWIIYQYIVRRVIKTSQLWQQNDKIEVLMVRVD